MAIYVDELRSYNEYQIKKGAQKYGKQWCHLVTDGTKEELHQFAESIGLKREWFQDHPHVWHYDLVPTKRALAISKGAIEADFKSISIMEIRREKIEVFSSDFLSPEEMQNG